jgi:hypothetical protein
LVVPVWAPHTLANVSDAPVEFFSTFTPAYYVNYFRELADLSAYGRLNPEENLSVPPRLSRRPGQVTVAGLYLSSAGEESANSAAPDPENIVSHFQPVNS